MSQADETIRNMQSAIDALKRAERRRSTAAALGKLIAAIVVIVISFALAVCSLLLWAHVLQSIWGWFLTPGFGWAVSAFKAAVGLLLMVTFITRGIDVSLTKVAKKPVENEVEDQWMVDSLTSPTLMIALALLCWGNAWLYHHFL